MQFSVLFALPIAPLYRKKNITFGFYLQMFNLNAISAVRCEVRLKRKHTALICSIQQLLPFSLAFSITFAIGNLLPNVFAISGFYFDSDGDFLVFDFLCPTADEIAFRYNGNLLFDLLPSIAYISL